MNIRNLLAGQYTPKQIDTIIANAKKLPYHEQVELLQLLEQYEKYLKVQKCQNNFMDFVREMWPAFIPGRHHGIMADAFERVANGTCKRLMINMPPRHRLRVNTEIPCVSGWKTVESVQVGDYVFSPDGTPVMVTGKSEVYEEEIFEVVTSDNQVIECDGEHLWTVRFGSGNPYRTMSTLQILDKLENESWRRMGNYPMLPAYSAAQYPHRELPIDPYVLGVWLGCGSSCDGSIGASFADMEAKRSLIEACGFKTTHNPKYQKYNILGLITALKDSGLLRNKHIPEEYLTASIEQRMSLLQGLIDTDGNVSVDGKVCFNNSNHNLIKQVLCLVHSLGAKAQITQREANFKGVPGQTAYRIMFKMEGAARLPRKASRCRKLMGNWGRSIDIRRTGRRGLVQCLEVQNDDGLFMAGRGWMVTHNTKSEFSSYLLPAWYLGKFPDRKIIQTAHTAELAVGFGRKVRNLVGSPHYQSVFSGVSLSSDSKAAGRWNTNKNGSYFAIGSGGAVTGQGANLLIIDDVHSEQEAAIAISNPSVYDSVYEWYTSGPRQRLQPGGSIVIVQTRWSKRDLCGQILKASAQRGGDEWEVIEFPAIMPSGTPLWPEFWSLEELEKIRIELPVGKWNAQYQQNPTSEEGALIKREWWKIWEADDPPQCDYIIQSWDTALTKGTRSDYSACTTWGVFYDKDADGKKRTNIIILNAYQDKLEFPELKQKALEEYKYWKPDTCIIEAKAAGAPLVFEMRKMGIPIQDYTPSRGNDKIARVNAVSDIFASGFVYAPPLRWAEEVIEQFASFPNSDHDDLVDSSTQALLRFRQGGFISTQSDEDEAPIHRKKADYY